MLIIYAWVYFVGKCAKMIKVVAIDELLITEWTMLVSWCFLNAHTTRRTHVPLVTTIADYTAHY